MAELVDALVSGTSVSNDVQVRVLSWALSFDDRDCFWANDIGLVCAGGGIGRRATLRG